MVLGGGANPCGIRGDVGHSLRAACDIRGKKTKNVSDTLLLEMREGLSTCDLSRATKTFTGERNDWVA